MSTDTALVVIDVQYGVVGEAYRRDEVLENISTLLDRARSNGTPVIYVQHYEPVYMEPGMEAFEIHTKIAPHEGEPVIQKESPDSFHETRLQEELDARGIKHLVITGAETQMCIDSSVRRAVSVGYDVTLVGDAHTTGGSQVLSSEQVIALHNEALHGFWAGKHRVRVLPTSEVQF